jgi:hypothetical protein
MSNSSIPYSVVNSFNVYNQVSSSSIDVLDEAEMLYHELKMCRYITKCVALSKEYGVPIQTFIPYFTHAKRRAELDALLVYGKRKRVPVGLTAKKMLTLRKRVNILQYKVDRKEGFRASVYFRMISEEQQDKVKHRIDSLKDKIRNITKEMRW